MTAKRIAYLAVVLLAGTRGGAAQEPAGPPPPSSRVEDRGTAVLELLPAIGRIGPQAGLIAGLSRNPYGAGSGLQAAGYPDVPVDPFLITGPPAYVANPPAGARPAAALAGPAG